MSRSNRPAKILDILLSDSAISFISSIIFWVLILISGIYPQISQKRSTQCPEGAPVIRHSAQVGLWKHDWQILPGSPIGGSCAGFDQPDCIQGVSARERLTVLRDHVPSAAIE